MINYCKWRRYFVCYSEFRILEEQTKDLEFLNADALGPSDACPEETVWCIQRKIRGRLYPAESF